MSRTRHHHHRRMHWAGPGIWHHIQTERPNRRKTKMLENDVRRSGDAEAFYEWPLPKKPHQYFW